MGIVPAASEQLSLFDLTIEYIHWNVLKVGEIAGGHLNFDYEKLDVLSIECDREAYPKPSYSALSRSVHMAQLGPRGVALKNIRAHKFDAKANILQSRDIYIHPQ